MNNIRTKITADVQKIVADYGLRLRGSWLYSEQHFVATKDRLFSLSDIDIISDKDLLPSSEEALRANIEATIKDFLLFSPAISIRNITVNNDASQATNHNTPFWLYIALLELKHAVRTSGDNDYCDAGSYFMNKFLLTIWRNILLDAGKSPTSYSSVLDALDNLSHHDKEGLLSIKKGEHPASTTSTLIAEFHNYTTTWVKTNSRDGIRKNLLDILVPGAYNTKFTSIFDKLNQAAATETELEIIIYSKAKVGQEY